MPNGNGPIQYFQEIKRDQLSAAVVKTGVIDDAFIMICLQYAFMESGHDKELICVIDVEWAILDTAFEITQGAVVHQDTQFRRFQDYYNSRLKRLYDNGKRSTEHQAHHVLEFETRMKHMEARLDRASDNAE